MHKMLLEKSSVLQKVHGDQDTSGLIQAHSLLSVLDKTIAFFHFLSPFCQIFRTKNISSFAFQALLGCLSAIVNQLIYYAYNKTDIYREENYSFLFQNMLDIRPNIFTPEIFLYYRENFWPIEGKVSFASTILTAIYY